MPLTELDRVRYARHLLLPEIGASGQERLNAACVRAPTRADAGALAVARDYLMRAGVTTSTAGTYELSIPSESELADFAGSPELIEAARALCGALAAVEAVKAVLALGAPLVGAPDKLSSEEV